jgi:hypothetical protein
MLNLKGSDFLSGDHTYETVSYLSLNVTDQNVKVLEPDGCHRRHKINAHF